MQAKKGVDNGGSKCYINWASNSGAEKSLGREKVLDKGLKSC
jgi:hypothetical protein